MEEMLNHRGDSIRGKRCALSGSGNVALHCAEKIIALGGQVVTLSDSAGFIHDPNGIDSERLEWIKALKFRRRGRIEEYAEQFTDAKFYPDVRPWSVPCDLAFPCATQNEIDSVNALDLVRNGCLAVAEGANMPTTNEAIAIFRQNGLAFAPGKAANAGGVAVSGLEMSQNSMRLVWTAEETETKLRSIMAHIHAECLKYGVISEAEEGVARGAVDYVKGANIAGFIKVADAMLAYGVV